MTESSSSPQISIHQFAERKQFNLFNTLKHPQFTGQLIFGSSKGEEWTFYLYLGRIVYATGGSHPVRRWMRNLKKFTPGLIYQVSEVAPQILAKKQFQKYWEYELLSYWFHENVVTREHLSEIIHNIIVEILFDITQRMEIVFQLSEEFPLSTQLVFINPDQVIRETSQMWSAWQESQLADRFPDYAPVILQGKKLRKRTSEKSYQMMSQLFNGKNTLRDLSIQLSQDINFMTRMILPYIQLGLIDLIAIQDLPCPLKFP